MRVSFRHLLPVLLLCSPWAAHAQIETNGDYWLVHTQGNQGNNEAFVLDADPAHLVKRADGVVWFGVHRVYQNPRQAMLTAYGVEVDCAKARVRIKKADNIDGPMGGVSSVKVSSAWQATPEPWLAHSRDFVCQPGNRTRVGLMPMGRMEMLRLVDATRVYFTIVQREQARDAILKDIYDAIDRMPQK